MSKKLNQDSFKSDDETQEALHFLKRKMAVSKSEIVRQAIMRFAEYRGYSEQEAGQ